MLVLTGFGGWWGVVVGRAAAMAGVEVLGLHLLLGGGGAVPAIAAGAACTLEQGDVGSRLGSGGLGRTGAAG